MDIQSVERIQNLWNNYGTLSRIYLSGSSRFESVIVKHIQIPQQDAHPKGFTSSFSKQRKIKSYQVETHWYLEYNHIIANSVDSPTPRCLDAFNSGSELFLLLEDLSTRGFSKRIYNTSWNDITVVLRWLAHFHAQFLTCAPDGLWQCGTYWHLATRPEEYNNIRNTNIHTAASFIDAKLQGCSFQTFVHGDAKLANFCFYPDRSKVAAVDFQYVGRGCGMKDVAYFVGSCLNEQQCKQEEQSILNFYFSQLRSHLSASKIDCDALESEWRSLYHTAWADFQRFLLGWSPHHQKNNSYSQIITRHTVEQIFDELLEVAISACKKAGEYVRKNWKKQHNIDRKGFESHAADMVTQVDIQAQNIISDILSPTMKLYDLGLLAEEGTHDDSRFQKHAFWTIDPLDGTQFFVEGKEGFAISIGLVSNQGEAILGVVYDPVNHNLYHAIKGRGFYINNQRVKNTNDSAENTQISFFADRSLQKHPQFPHLETIFNIQFVGGAVMNTIHVLTNPFSIYCKPPKKSLGGCAIWDLAAVSLILTEAGGTACFFDGSILELNRKHSIYFNDVGLFFSSSNISYTQISKILPL